MAPRLARTAACARARYYTHLRAAERAAASRLALLVRMLRLGAVEHLEELGDARAHAAVHVCLGAFDWVSHGPTQNVLW